MNIITLLQMASDTYPDRIAVRCDDKSLTYQELSTQAMAAAALFKESGCLYVAVRDTSSIAIPVALFGAAAAGIPYVPLNYRLDKASLESLMARIKPAYLIDTETRAEFLQSVLNTPVQQIDIHEDPEAVTVQLFTSGTTGAPKAAILRASHLLAYILGSVEFANADEHEASLMSVPPYHIAGISAVLSSVYSCRSIIFLPAFDAEQWIQQVKKYKVSNAFVVPTMLARIVERLEQQDTKLPSLRALAYGGGKMPRKVITKALNLLPNTAFSNAYGLTETSSTISLLGPQEHRHAIGSNNQAEQQRLCSVGKPLPSIEIEVRNDNGEVLTANQTGELYVRGPQVSGEYKERRAIDDNGWFATRDVGYIDELGYLFLDARADDIIVRGGENISPGEIEDILLEDSDVKDVCVVAVPDDTWGEAVAAAIVTHTNLQGQDQNLHINRLKELVRSRLRSSKIPSHIVVTNELPYNDMGKLLRRQVRDQLCQSLR